MHSVASEALSQENVPIRLPFIVHVLLYSLSNLCERILARLLLTYLSAVALKIVLFKRLLGNRDRVL